MNDRDVPFVDLAAHHAPIRAALDRAIARVVDRSAFVLGEEPLAPAAPETTHVFHLDVVRVADDARDDLRAHLAAEGIDTGIHYPIPMHLQPALAHLQHRQGDFPIAERLAGEILSLPMYPELEPAQAERVVDTIETFARRRFAGVRFGAAPAEDFPQEALVSPGEEGGSGGGDTARVRNTRATGHGSPGTAQAD